MKEEFTTKMHSELLGKEESIKDIEIMEVYALLWKRKSLKKALDECQNVTAESFKENIVRVLGYKEDYKEELFKRMKDYLDV